MRIGLNLLYLLPGIVGGTETYAAGLLHGLSQVDDVDEFIVFVNQESADWPLPHSSKFVRVVCPVAATNRIRRYAYEQFLLPGTLKRYRVDVVHSLGYVGPLVAPCPSTVTIHDLNYVALRSLMAGGKRRFLQFFSTQSAKRAGCVITDSDFSKSELVQHLGIPASRIAMIHLGPGWSLPADSRASFDALRSQYNLPPRYVAAFGGGSAHKNIVRFVRAFSEASQGLEHSLVLIGHLPPKMDLPSEAKNANLSLDRITALGYVPATHIAPILSHADLFVLPSLYEGFGLPVLEAQQAGVAIACSRAASLPEIAGEGAVFFDPLSVENMAEVIRRCLGDSELRMSLQQLGRENVQRFSWEKTARETLAVYHNLCHADKAKRY